MACSYYYNGASYTKEELINLINEGKVADEQRSELLYTLYDQAPLRVLMRIDETATLEEHIDSNYPGLINKVRKYNPNVTFSFDEKKGTAFDPLTNNVNISLSSLYKFANDRGLDYEDVLNYSIEHESEHALTMPGSVNPKIEAFLNKALNKAKQLYDTNPFEDNHRGNIAEERYPYAFNTIYEFMAEMRTNPDLNAWMKTISSGEESFWEKIVNYIRNLIGLGPVTSMYKSINDLINSEDYVEAGNEILEFYMDDFKALDIANLNKIWYNTSFILNENFESSPNLQEVYESLPKIISSIKKEILKYDPKSKDAKNLNLLIQRFYNISENKDKVKFLIDSMQSAYLIATSLKARMDEILSVPNTDEDTVSRKSSLLFALNKQAESLKSIIPTVTELSKIITDKDYSDTISPRFVSQISLIQNIQNQVYSEYLKLSKVTTIQKFSIINVNEGLSKILLQEREQKLKYLATLTDPLLINITRNRIADIDKRLNLVPTENVISAIINGELPDASVVDLNLQSLALNGNTFIQSAAKLLFDADNRLAARRVERENTMQTIITNIKKSLNLSTLRSMKSDITEKVTEKVKRVVRVYENAEGGLEEETVEQLKFITDYSADYIYEYEKILETIKFWEDKRSRFKKSGNKEQDEIKRKELNDKIYDLYEQKYKFKKENSESYYKDSYYVHKELLNEKITGLDESGNTVTISLNDAHGEIFEQIEAQEAFKRHTTDPAELIAISEELERLWAIYSEIALPYTNTGFEKEGIQKLLYEQSLKYREAKNKIGQRIFTDSDKLAYTNLQKSMITTRNIKLKTETIEMQALVDALASGKISIPEHDQKISEVTKRIKAIDKEYEDSLKSIQQIRPTKQYFEDREELRVEVEKIRSQILLIPEIKELLGGEEESKKLSKENYKKLADLSKVYRDNEGAVDGRAFTKNKKEAVAVVKQIQEAEQLLSDNMRKITGLSYAENKEYYDLAAIKGLRTNDQEIRFQELKALKLSLKEIKSQTHKELFESYTNALSRLMSMSESKNTKYYEQEVLSQKRDLKIKLENEAKSRFSDWLKENNITKNTDGTLSIFQTREDGTIVEIKKYTNDLEAISRTINATLEEEFQNSDWYINNHFKRRTYNKEEQQVEIIDSPIYIWVEQTPKDDVYIGEPEPLDIFKTFVINDDQKNENYELIAPGLSRPKTTSKYYNTDKLNDLKRNKPLSDLHQNLRAFYKQTQDNSAMTDSERLYDILPSVPKHTQENKINSTDSVLGGNIKDVLNRFWASGLGKIDDDSQVIEGGSIDRKYVEEKLIPFRFNNKMDVSKQSYDLFSSLLIYDNINSDVLNKKGLEETFQTALSATDDLERRTETVVGGAFNIMNVIRSIRGKSKNQKITEVQSGKSVINQTLQHMLDTHIYGETKTDAVYTILGAKVDGHKVASSIKKVSSKMIFALKWFGPVKNYLSTILNGYTNTGLGEGFATREDYTRAVALAPSKMPYLLQDYRKIGNKSKFGQAMDYFKVLHGGVINEYGQTVQWTALGELNGRNLTIIKNSTELLGQTTTFLSISFANQVELNNRKVPFHEAFETVNGVFQPIKGAKFNGEDITQAAIDDFIGKVAHLNRKLNGAFRELEKSKVEKSALGSMAFYLNGFVMPGIKARFGKEQYFSEGNFISRGYYNAGFSFLREGFKNAYKFGQVYNSLSKVEKRRVGMFAQEVLIAFLFSLTVALMSAGDEDKKKQLKKNSAAYNYMFALIMGVGSEYQTFVPSPGAGMDEFLRKAASPFAAVRQLVLFGKMLGHFGEIFVGEGRFEKNGVGDGLHDKGDPKIIADVIALMTGWNMKEWDSVEKVIQVKSAQQLR